MGLRDTYAYGLILLFLVYLMDSQWSFIIYYMLHDTSNQIL